MEHVSLKASGTFTLAEPPKGHCKTHGEVKTSTFSLWQGGEELARTPPMCPYCYFQIQSELFKGAFLADTPNQRR